MVGSLNINLLNGDVLVSCKMASLKLAVGIFVYLFWGLVAFCKQKKKTFTLHFSSVPTRSTDPRTNLTLTNTRHERQYFCIYTVYTKL